MQDKPAAWLPRMWCNTCTFFHILKKACVCIGERESVGVCESGGKEKYSEGPSSRIRMTDGGYGGLAAGIVYCRVFDCW